MTLVPYTGWACLACGHRSRTALDEGPDYCCPDRVAIRVLVDEVDLFTAAKEPTA